MKQFLKFTLASMLGIILASILLFLIMLGIGTSMSKKQDFKLESNSILKVTLDGDIVEQSMDIPFNFNIPGIPAETKAQQGLDDILAAITKAKSDDHIKGIYLEAKFMNAGYPTASEIRKALLDFRKSGKFVYAYGNMYEQKAYYICTAADRIFINPSGMLQFSGLVANPMFFKGTLDKLGVKPEIFKVGTFKSAVEPYINTKMSDASRTQVQSYLDDIWSQLLKDISSERKISEEKLEQLADRNTLFELADTLVTVGMMDSVVYETGMMELLAKKTGVEDPDDLTFVSVKNMASVPVVAKEFAKEKIAVLYAEGEIFDAGNEGISAENMVEEIVDIRKDSLIKAVVLRVNSPGGSASASEQIWRAIEDLKKVKPVVVSMSDLAASGGYYIACGANKIIASPNTLTGSIGIFATFFVVDELTRKLGLSFDVVKTNSMGDLGSPNRPMNPAEKGKIQQYVNRGYDLFVKRCSEGRKIEEADLRKIAEGRVWTGNQALKIGLVDELGGLDKAIEEAAKLAKLKNYRMDFFPEKKDFMTIFMEEMSGDLRLKISEAFLGDEYRSLIQLRKSGLQSGILAKTPPIEIQ